MVYGAGRKVHLNEDGEHSWDELSDLSWIHVQL